ncbi:uncharacterized protein [Palaemon carinicauda]|uniref:uncharacterized protein n=1 Tax=Palaemon carinicauda TaxID=392227 RepID=UPI0035B6721E
MWGILVTMFLITSTECQFVFPSDNCDISQKDFCQCNLVNITCDCGGKNMTLKESQPLIKDKTIIIRNCNQLSILKGSLKNSGPIRMILENISNLDLVSSSFQMDASDRPTIHLQIKNATINKLPNNTFTAEGRTGGTDVPVLKFLVENTLIRIIEATAFGNFEIDSMTFINSCVTKIYRFAVMNVVRNELNLINTKFKTVAKNAISLQGSAQELNIQGNIFGEQLPLFVNGTIERDVHITDNVFPSLRESPWSLYVKSEAYLRNNTFANIPRKGLNIKVKKRIVLKDNVVGRIEGYAFKYIMPLGNSTEIFFTGNTFGKHDFMALCLDEDFHEDNIHLKNNVFQEQCFCNFTKYIATGLGERNLTTKALHVEKIHQQWLLQSKCIHQGSKVLIDLFLVKSCQKYGKLTSVLIITFVAIFLTVLISAIVVWRFIKRLRSTQSDADYQSFTVPAPSSLGNTPWSLVQPDPRTYQEVEIHVLFQKAEEMEDPEGQDECEKTDGDVNDACKERKPKSDKKNDDSLVLKEGHRTESGDLKTIANNSEKSNKDNKRTNEKKAPLIRQSCPAFSNNLSK